MTIGSPTTSSSLSAYLRDIRELPTFAKEPDPVAVAHPRANGETTLANQLVGANLRFVVGVAREYSSLGLPLEDLLNEGNLGLIEATRRFDPRHGTRFISYAVWWIRKSIRTALTRHSTNVYVPEYQLNKVRRIRSAENSLSRTLGRGAAREEISRELGIEVAKVDRILRFKLREISLDDPVDEGGETPLSDVLADRTSVNPEEELIRRETLGTLRHGLRRLTHLQQVVIINRFGLGGGPSFHLSEIGRRLGFSRERARQIEAKSERKLRRIFEGRRRGAWCGSNEICCASGSDRGRWRLNAKPLQS